MENCSSNYYTYKDLLKIAKQSGRNYDLSIIEKAYQVAKKAHGDQKRVSGVEYILHPISVAYIVIELGMDTACVAAALLHDVIEDTSITKDDVKNLFGEEICNLVDGLTKLRRIRSKSVEEQQAENVKKMLLAMSHDIRVIIIKLADRLQNMRTIECMPVQKQRDKSLQNMEVFAPIAHRLGIRTIKDELEDISLKCLDPIAYKEVENSLALCKADREKFLNLIKKRVIDRVQKYVPDIYIEGRVKSANEIYKKMFIKGKNLDQIYDVYAIRIIVSTINDCYNVFGIIHDMFQPIPSRFKDYISTPKPNMYQSLHTTVLTKEGIPFEVQIRTWEMHRTAEYGIAAHWKYKLGLLSKSGSFSDSLTWVNKLLENYKNIEDVTDVVKSIKSDLVPKEIFVLTPKGGVITLPVGSTVIDFAYAIHTELGNKMIGAKVNKKIVPITYALKTGEIAEIISTKDPQKGPSRDWINTVKTSEARNKIKQWFKRECREENVVEGKIKFEAEMDKHKIYLPQEGLKNFLGTILKKNNFESLDDFFAAVGYGGIQLWKIMPRLKKEHSALSSFESGLEIKNKFSNSIRNPGEKGSEFSSGIIVEGMKNCRVKFAKCCNPFPGDEIVGFVTRGYGVSIHKKSCQNFLLKQKDPDLENRWIKVSWCESSRLFDTNLEIEAKNREEFLTNLTRKISAMNVKLISLNSKIIPDNKILALITLEVKNQEHLSFITSNLLRINGIISLRKV